MKEKLRVKYKAKPSNYGTDPYKRPIEEHLSNCLIILDKPSGPTSHEVVAWVKKILSSKKAGHSGTLDPHVTGVLPIAVDNATKIMPALTGQNKEYVCLMYLHQNVETEKLRKVMQDFVGEIEQLPPLKSAVKRQVRKRNIYFIDLLEHKGQYVLFKAEVQAGTYMRVLCRDIGKSLGINAHMQQLRRTRAGPFTEEEAVTLHELKDAYEYWKESGDDKYLRAATYPVEYGVKHIPKVVVKDSAVYSITNGSPLMVAGISQYSSNIKKGDLVAIMTLKGELVALGKAKMDADEIKEKDYGIAVATDRVIMKKGVYPKF